MRYKTTYNIKDIHTKGNLLSEDNVNHTKIISIKDDGDDVALSPLICTDMQTAKEWCNYLNQQNTKNTEKYTNLQNEISSKIEQINKDIANLQYLYNYLIDKHFQEDTSFHDFINKKCYKREYEDNITTIRNRLNQIMQILQINKDLTDDSQSKYEYMFNQSDDDYTDYYDDDYWE